MIEIWGFWVAPRHVTHLSVQSFAFWNANPAEWWPQIHCGNVFFAGPSCATKELAGAEMERIAAVLSAALEEDSK